MRVVDVIRSIGPRTPGWVSGPGDDCDSPRLVEGTSGYLGARPVVVVHGRDWSPCFYPYEPGDDGGVLGLLFELSIGSGVVS